MKITNRYQRACLFLLWGAFLYIGYQLTNRYPIFEPSLMPMIFVDELFAFNVWTIIPYYLLILLSVVPIFIKNKDIFIAVLMATTFTVLLNYLIFILLPTTYIRPEFIPTGYFVDAWYLSLMTIDQPTNCFPSGHIAVPGLAVYFFVKDNPKLRFMIVLYLLFSLSVLTTKQHYFWDILGGWVSLLCGIIFSQKAQFIRVWCQSWIK
ncbi:MAG: phosphatase PAP2 family protein [Saccharospirillaceae bacterium]|nr:phosphatase PAP2 family protein [Pseudomonadales bacterium]NRB77506.1 phosphatase PAP2 family protein [Saccharospirillaceae bacterium]